MIKYLMGEGLFTGYIINLYNQYSKKPIQRNNEWIQKIPQIIKTNLSEKHCRNGLVERSWKQPLSLIKDFGQLSPLSQQLNKAILNLDPYEDKFDVIGIKELLLQSKEQFTKLVREIIDVLEKY